LQCYTFVSYCDVTMFGRLQNYYVWYIAMLGNVCHVATSWYICHITTWGNFCHIATTRWWVMYFYVSLSLSHCDVRIQILTRYLCSSHCDANLYSLDWDVNMFNRLRHIATLRSTLWWHAYIRHIVMLIFVHQNDTLLCTIDCNIIIFI
jgi:hypothetical protein